MKESGQTSAKLAPFRAHSCADRVATFLRARHPIKTAIHVEAETGISAETVRGWLNGHAPNGDAIVDLVDVYGPDFLSAVRPHRKDAWFVYAARRLKQQQLERQLAETEAELNDLRSGS